MSQYPTYHPFDPYNIPLQGLNLIEASAGTGKTYSITLLVLRLLLEKNIPIQEILMVTFTNAAAAELEIRIRDFVRKAYELSRDSSHLSLGNSEREILQIFDKTGKSGEKSIRETLEEAMLFMDELKVMTIHGFCQKTLLDFALETGQLFDATINNDPSVFLEQVINNFWRKEVTTLPPEIISLLGEVRFNRQTLAKASVKMSEGFEPKAVPMPDFQEILPLVQQSLKEAELIKEFVDTHWEAYLLANSAISTGRASSAQAIKKNDPSLLIKAINNGVIKEDELDKMKVRKEIINYPPIVHFIERLRANRRALQKVPMTLANALLRKFYVIALPEIEQYKSRNSILTFSDLIRKLYLALQEGKNKGLIRKLQWTYKAVFIDEFQDTDSWQYGIFKTVFHTAPAPLLFYIGDPKQLIYSWRGADLKMYKTAVGEITQRYTMDVNYRSSPNFIQAMNLYFPTGKHCSTGESNNPFCDDLIRYLPVRSGKDDLPTLVLDNEELPGLLFAEFNSDKTQAVVQKVLHLLHQGEFRHHEGPVRPVQPEDIAILTRSNREAQILKKRLSIVGVPSIIRDETKVFSTETAQYMYYILYGFLYPDAGDLRRALYTPLTPQYMDPYDLPDIQYHSRIFGACKESWVSQGIFAAIQHFMAAYDVRNTLLSHTNINGERHFTNLIQLAEILNATEHFRQLTPEKLLDWMAKSMEDPPLDTEYEQRIETDAAALTISTIHKSKGLQYNIVLLPIANEKRAQNTKVKDIVTYEDIEAHPVVSFGYPDEAIEEEKQMAYYAENRRLYYVALTRAVFTAIVFDDGKNELLRAFQIPNNAPLNILRTIPLQEHRYPPYQAKAKPKIKRKPLPFTGDIRPNWITTSYSGLDTHVHKAQALPPVDTYATEYDKFIFDTLPKGPQIGNFLHYLLEYIAFDQSGQHPLIIRRASRLFGQDQPELLKGLPEMLEQVIEADIRIGNAHFRLRHIPFSQRMNELEFFFDFSQWPQKRLREIFDNIQTRNIPHPGIMHGFIDLLLEYDGKFYILDWKSNHLGHDLSGYEMAGLRRAMEDNNYTLQYHVYTLAAVRFLRTQIPNFDYDLHFGGVIYVFLRGVRAGQKTGVFTAKPTKENITLMDQFLSKPS